MTQPAGNTSGVGQAGGTAAPPTANVLRFRDGIPGFPDHREFQLVDLIEDGVFQLLQSLEDEHVAMIVAVPWVFFPDYVLELDDDDQRDLGISKPEDAIVFCPVTLDVENEVAWMNLLGPFIVNFDTREGRQVVLSGDQPMRAPIELG